MTEEPTWLWRKSSHSASGACVEFAVVQDSEVRVRDSKNPDGPKLVLTRVTWMAVLTAAKKGHLDL
ncbi:MAG TPA: DUF397 domain-containing protein [Micromonosporaceae bacterium]